MRRSLQRMIRPVAGMLMLAFAVLPSARCLASSLVPEQKACCATMGHDCGKEAVTASCCPGDTHQIEGVVTPKAGAACAPVVALVALLVAAPAAIPASAHSASGPETSSTGPPGIPTYLFVSSFRI